VPANVLDAAERLRRELRPERGPVDWRPVAERRGRADYRIRAVEEYARETGCRRAHIVGYFGERLERCSGCDRCTRKARVPPVSREVTVRLGRLRHALAGSKAVWGGCPLEPEVLLALAKNPPCTAAALADVPGVGPALAERLGGSILGALGPVPHDSSKRCQDSVRSALQEWRSRVAGDMGVPPYTVLTDSVLDGISQARPVNRAELARVQGIGPRALAKFGDALLSIAATRLGVRLVD
jgi:superfamily II DNA helicase RecQ